MAGTLTIDTLKASTGPLATQNGMTGICKAWVAYNLTGSAIRGSYNVSSVTKNGTGDFTLNFTTAMADANYCVVGTGGVNNNEGVVQLGYTAAGAALYPPSTTACRCAMKDMGANTNVDRPAAYVAIVSN
jgi:hypothetical protein